MDHLSQYTRFAVETAKDAGALLMENYGRMHSLEWKLRNNFKIEVDDMSDALIRKRISLTFPNHSIYSEEAEAKLRDSDFTWVIDPLDGTIPYTYGVNDHFAVCIALTRNGTPITGVTFAPMRKELYVAEEGKGAFLNGEPIQVLQEENLNKILMTIDSGKETPNFKRASMSQTISQVYSPRADIVNFFSYGCASVSIAQVGAGKLHAYTGLSLEPWDMASGVIINREAGAIVTNLKGDPWKIGDESILSANPQLHRKLLDLLNN